MTAHRRRVFGCVFTALAVVFGGLLSTAEQAGTGTSPATAPLSTRIPVDQAITSGRFPNGLRYYVRANGRPEGRAELRLAVNAGSVLEEDDQRGLAHFVEHMAFNGTRNFPKQAIVDFVQSIGMRFGSDLNAYTGFDETVYQLEVPTDKPAVLDRAMLILGDWAQHVTFDPAEIDKERGVVLEEWRLGRNAQGRLRDKQLPVLLRGSRYADRLPIGTPEVLQKFTHARLRQFYADWYRPDLMAVVAVGDFDVKAIEALIQKHFAPIPARKSPRPRPPFPVPDHAGTAYAIATDAELAGTSVSVYHTMPARDQSTIAAYRQQIVLERLFTGMLNARLGEIALKPGAPFLGAGAGVGPLVRTTDAWTLAAGVREGGVEAGLDALFSEAARVAASGFTAPEFERQKTIVMRALERAIVEKENQQSSALAAEYIRNFTTTEPIPGIAYEYELHKRFVPQISLAEMNALARSWVPDRNRVVVVSAPAKPGVAVPTEKQLAAVMAAAAAKSLKPYEESVSARPLIASAPKPGSVVSTTTREAWGITEWKLSNGITVLLKPTTFRQDEVMFEAFSPGGTSLATDSDFIPAETAAQVVNAGGLASFSAVDLDKVVRGAGKLASVGASIGDYSEELNGRGSPKDLETLFQLIYLRVTQPRADPTIFSVMTEQTKIALANQKNQPEFAFSEALASAMWRDHLRARPMTAELVDQMSLEKSMAFYKERFADVGDFTFVFVGSFDLATIKPLVETYLASLPAGSRKETWKDVGMRRATGVVGRRVNRGIEQRSQTTVIFSGPFQYDQQHRVTIRAMSMVLDGLLRDALREDLGGTYGVSVSSAYSKIPTPEYTMSISFGSEPSRADALLEAAFKKIEELKANGPSERDLNNIREILLRDYESNTKQNGFFLREIASRVQHGEDLKDLFGLTEYYKKLSAADIQQAAQACFNMDNYVKVQLFPEK